jgi:thiol-disulfide isomerase/thioredoxin
VKALVSALLFTGILSAALPTVDEAGYAKAVAAQKGKVVLVNFWATYCVPCRAEMPKLVSLQSRLKDKGFTLVTISADEQEQEAAAQQFLQKINVPQPSYRRQAKDDDKFINTIDPKWSGALPMSILYDRNGRKVKTFTGELSMPVIEAEIKKLL